jgi:hypothetical protein
MDKAYEDSRTRTSRALDRSKAKASAAAPLLGIGGLALLVGTLLTWIDAGDAAGGTEVAGASLSDGRLVMGIGVGMLLMGIYMATTRRYGHWFDADLLGATLGAIATTVIVTTWIALPDGQTADLGLYVSLAGAVLGLFGALAALAGGRADHDDSRSPQTI